jgi:hypothetical protein
LHTDERQWVLCLRGEVMSSSVEWYTANTNIEDQWQTRVARFDHYRLFVLKAKVLLVYIAIWHEKMLTQVGKPDNYAQS